MSKKLIFNEQNIVNNDSSTPQTNSSSFNQMNTPNPFFQMDPETLQNFIMFQNFMKMQNMMSSANSSNVNTMASTIPQITPNVHNSKDPNETPNVNPNLNTKSNVSSVKFAIESNNHLALENNHRANIVNQSIEKMPTETKVNKVNKLGEATDKQTHNKTNSFSKNSRNAEMDDKYLQNNNDSIGNSPEIETNNKSYMNNHLIVGHDDNHELSNNTNNNISDISGINLQNKEAKNKFDEMPIKKGPSNFLELLEQNLQNEGEFQNEGETRKRIIKHERFKKVIKVSTPDEKEKKKYKYYLQNFDKKFGEDGYVETSVLPPPIFEKKEEKGKGFKTKSRSVQKFNQKGRKAENPSANEKEKINLNNQSKDKHSSNVVPIGNKKTAVVDKKKEPANNNLAKKGVKKSENLNNIWGEQNNAGDDDYDDFLDLEREAKQSLKKIPINPANNNIKSNIKAENLNQSPKAQSKLKENLNFNVKTDQDKAKFNIGFNMPKEDAENKIELKSTQMNQVKSKTLNQILNNHYHTNQPKNPFYESKLNSELNKLNMMNHGIDIKEIEDFKEEKEESQNQEDYISESEEAKQQEIRKKSPKSEESDDRNIEEMFKNNDKIQSSPLKYKEEKDEFSSKQFPENIEKQVKKTQITNMTNVSVKPSIIKKNVNPVETKKQMNENAEDYKDNYTEIANEKLKELNNEIVKLKSENEKASKMKHEYEKLTILLQQEIKEFNDKKERELREFENYKEEEKSKLLKEKKLFDKNLKALQNQQTGPNRKEREEIESLKQQIQKVTEESKKKETTNKLAIERFKRQLDEANNKVSELSKELKNLEELRLKGLENKNNKPSKQTTTNQVKSIGIPSNTQSNQNSNFNTVNYQSNNKIKEIINNDGLKEKNYRFSDDSPPIEEKSNDPQEISFDERDSFSEKGNYKKVDIVQNVKSIVPHSTKQQTSEQTIFKPAQVYQTQVKTNNSEKLENILNTIENNKNKNINNNSIKSTNNDKAEKENTQSKSKSPQKSVSQKEDLPNLKQREVIVNKEEEEKVEEISQYEMRFPEIYHGKLQRSSKLIKQEVSNDGKILKIFENNKKEVIFPSGMRKEIYSDGYTIVFFGNKDIKQTFPEGKTVYYFAESKTTQTTETDGTQIFKFDNNQLEKHYPDGSKEINFPDGTLKYILADGYEETFLPDGTLHKVDKNGVTMIDYVNGAKDTIYPDGRKIKEFPDGRIKKIYPDGRVESSFKQN